MSGKKYIDRICIAGIILSVVLTLLFINGEALGVTKIVDEDTQASETAEVFTDNDLDGSWDTSTAVQIVIEGDNGTISGDGAYFLDGDLVIAAPGKYVISGTLDDGSIIVDFEQSAKVWIMLNGVDITCQDDACLRVDEADKVFLTLAEGSENRMESGETYSEEALSDGTGGVIYSHDDLTINGSGSLTLTSGYKHGIESNDDLVITGGTISITCVQDGMHVNDKLKITGTSITVNAGDDALHCDTEVYIESGTILLESCYEGIEAPTVTIDGGDITIFPSDDGINANGGESSNGFGNMAVFPGGDEAMEGAGPAWPADTEEAMSENELTQISGTGETTADAVLPSIQEMDGSNDQTAPGAQAVENADTEESSDELPVITINGGVITVINESGRDADGLDSNGDIFINGGTVFVSLNGTGGNNGLDYGSENGGQCLINGGVVIACADSSMLEEISDDSAQCTLSYVPDETVSAGATVSITDTEGNTILTREIPCSFSSLVLSSPKLQQGKTYTLSVHADETDQEAAIEVKPDDDFEANTASNTDTNTDTDSIEVTFDETVVSIGSAGGFSMNGMPGAGQLPDTENMSEGRGPDFESMDENEMPAGMPAMPDQNSDTAEETDDTAEGADDTGMERQNTDYTDNMSEAEGSEARPNGGNERPDMSGGPYAMSQMGVPMSSTSQQETNAQSEAETVLDYDSVTWVWMIVCVAALLGGIIFVKKYK